MSVFIDKTDVINIRDATSQVLKDAIGQIAAVLVPAIAASAKDVAGGIVVTVGPITVEPIKITIGVQDEHQ